MKKYEQKLLGFVTPQLEEDLNHKTEECSRILNGSIRF